VRRVVPLLLAVLLGAGLLPLAAPPAAAQASCPAPGGAGFPAHTAVPAGDVQVLGRGWGHGVGMSQHGALGAARLGCSAAQILSTYYPGTQLSDRDTAVPITATLWPTRPQEAGAPNLDVRVPRSADIPAGMPRAEAVTWRIRQAEGGQVTDLPEQQPAGATWRAAIRDGRLELRDGERVVWSGPTSATLFVPLDNRRTIQLPQKSTATWSSQGRPYSRGSLRVAPLTGAGSQLLVQIDLPDVEQYLYGLSEMPSSWLAAALEAQAIAGRSYAMRKNPRILWESTADQVYAGALKERDPTGVGPGETAGQRWVRAVEASRRKVVTHDGTIAQTVYSSSHGGQSESNRFSSFFSAGNVIPYLVPIDDSRWDRASLTEDERTRCGSSCAQLWAVAFSRSEAGALLGVGSVVSIDLPAPRGRGGRVGDPNRAVYDNPTARYGGVRVVGTTATKVLSGLEFMNLLRVPRRSELFEVRVAPAPDRCTPTTDQSGNTTVIRLAGPSRVETAVAASASGWSRADEAVVATGSGFADALSAAALAARRNAPLLLTDGGSLAPSVRSELARLGVGTVHLMGGTSALSRTVEAELRAAGHHVERVAGANRFATASVAAQKAGPSPSGDVALALGADWPDAVSAGALAASRDRVPTLLSHRDEVPDVTMRALAALGARRVLLVGGSSVLTADVDAQLRREGYVVERLSGGNRYQTSVAVAANAVARGPAGARPVVLASGATFPDALAAGALAAKRNGVLLLTPQCNLDPVPETTAFLTSQPIDRGWLLGGRAALSDRVREQARAAIDG
jgi:peptidoglycan hydrolase-like amidase/putative cell wall-binding protein